MTLLYTEISPGVGGSGPQIYFAADRRITPVGAGRATYYKKLVEMPRLRAALGFFGLAEFRIGRSVNKMSEYLRAFALTHTSIADLSTFASELARSLNANIPRNLVATQRMGIHLAGFDQRNLPEFWFVRNVDIHGNPTVGAFSADEQFLNRDAIPYGFDGVHQNTLPTVGILYRNGDILPHVMAWQALDDSLGSLLGQTAFRGIQTPDDYMKWIHFKMEVLKTFHLRFQRQTLVGGVIDVIKISP